MLVPMPGQSMILGAIVNQMKPPERVVNPDRLDDVGVANCEEMIDWILERKISLEDAIICYRETFARTDPRNAETYAKCAWGLEIVLAQRERLAKSRAPKDDSRHQDYRAQANRAIRIWLEAHRLLMLPPGSEEPDEPDDEPQGRQVDEGQDRQPDPSQGRQVDEGQDRQPTVHHACDWLATILANGPRLQSELITLAKAAGLSERSLERAKAALSVQSKREGKPWVWTLPDMPPATDAPGEPDTPPPPIVTNGEAAPDLPPEAISNPCFQCGKPMQPLDDTVSGWECIHCVGSGNGAWKA